MYAILDRGSGFSVFPLVPRVQCARKNHGEVLQTLANDPPSFLHREIAPPWARTMVAAERVLTKESLAPSMDWPLSQWLSLTWRSAASVLRRSWTGPLEIVAGIGSVAIPLIVTFFASGAQLWSCLGTAICKVLLSQDSYSIRSSIITSMNDGKLYFRMYHYVFVTSWSR